MKEPDPFSGGGPNELHAFIFQCQIYFWACEGEFSKETDKVFFAISYLRGTALDYFEPFINEPDPYQSFNFLKNWSAFVQKLSNVFRLYSPEDNDEDAIVAITFSNEEKVVNYFIQFAKYQNHICWDDRSLWKVVKNALPSHVRDELRFSHEDMLFFEALKRTVLRIDNDYWKCQLEERNKPHLTRTSQNYAPKNPCPETNRPPNLLERAYISDKWPQEGPRSSPSTFFSACSKSHLPSASSILGPDGCLTQVERQYCMSMGLCMHCGQTSHLTRACPRQSLRPPTLVEGCTTHLEEAHTEPEHSKKVSAVLLFPSGPAA